MPQFVVNKVVSDVQYKSHVKIEVSS